MNCQHCNEPNPEGYFYCRNCEQRASAPKFTVNTIMRDTPMATAIRKDQIDFGSKSMGDHIKQVQKKNAEAREKKINSLIKWK